MTWNRCTGVAISILLLLASSAFAQRTTGDITGTVRDGTGAVVPGVTVSVTGANIAGAQTTTTTASGIYRIGNLPPGTYDVTYELAGFQTVVHRGLRVGLGATLEQSVTLELSTVAETLTVVAETPIVDTTSTEVGTTYSSDWIEAAPTRRYGFYDLVAHAPGAVKGGDGTIAGERRTMVFGSSFDENAFQLDGVNVTDNYWSEGFSEPNSDAIEEVEVLSLGAPAEYGNVTGAVYNIVTKQGTNAFHGDAGYFVQTNGMTSNNTDDLTLPNGTFLNACSDVPTNRCPWTRGDYYEVSAQLGGPIVRDKLWFFGSYGHQQDEKTLVGVNANNPGAASDISKDRYMVKTNWQITSTQRLVANFHYDRSPQDSGYSYNETPSTAWLRTQRAPTPGAAYTSVLSDRTLLDIRYSGFYGGVSGYPVDPNAPLSEARIFDGANNLITGGHYYWYTYDADRTTATAKISHHADDFLGSNHDFHFGVQYNQAGVSGVYGLNDFVYTYLYNGQTYGYADIRQPFSYGGQARNIGAFVDDNVRVNDRLTLNLGVRFDYSKAYTPEQEELDNNAQPTGVTFPSVDHYTWANVSPRLGLNFKLTGDGRTVVKTHWGRYHPQITTGEFANIIGPNVKPFFRGDYDAATGQITNVFLRNSNANLRIDPDYHAPHTDQFLVGVERELAKLVGMQFNYVRKWGRDFASWRDAVGQYVQVPIVDNQGQGATGETLNVFRLTSPPGERIFELGNNEGLFTNIHAVSATVTKRMTTWYLNGGVTWLHGRGAVVGNQASNTTIQQRSATTFNDNFGRNPNHFVNLEGPLANDTEWQFKLQGVVRLPWGFQASANVDHHSNAYLFRTRSLPTAVVGEPSITIIIQPRGELGRLPDMTIVDARLQKDVRLGTNARLALAMDVLNLNNENAHQSVRSASVTSSAYHYPSSNTIVNPRRLMLSAKFHF
jgi:hypothetical protein